MAFTNVELRVYHEESKKKVGKRGWDFGGDGEASDFVRMWFYEKSGDSNNYNKFYSPA